MKIDIPEPAPHAHELVMPIRWGDMDAMGHVNNSVYFRYLESGRLAWLRSLGRMPNPEGEGVVIVNAFCNFIHQLEHPGDIIVRTWAGKLGRSSLDTWATISRTDAPERVCAAGGATMVWVDFPRQKSIPFPDPFRAMLLQAGARSATA